MATKKGLSYLFELGTIYGQPKITRVFGTECFGFRMWVGSSSGGVSILRQIDSWYLPIEGSRALKEKCVAKLMEGAVVAISGERKTYSRYNRATHMLTSIQVNIGRRIMPCGFSDKMQEISTEIERLKSTDRMYIDTGKDISDDIGEEENLVG